MAQEGLGARKALPPSVTITRAFEIVTDRSQGQELDFNRRGMRAERQRLHHMSPDDGREILHRRDMGTVIPPRKIDRLRDASQNV